MPTNTTYNPEKTSDFTKGNLLFDGKSVQGVAIENETVNIDYLFTDDMLMTGGVLKVKGAKFYDSATLQIVHPVYGVVNQFVTDYYMSEDTQLQIDIQIPYPARLVAGLSVRLVYKATAEVGSRLIALNYELHKVLV